MSFLTLNGYLPHNITIVPNEFLDRYMPHANGEFVKVYLLLLRLSAERQSFSMSDAADMLSCTEKDIIRALRYWEKAGILELLQHQDGTVSGITFLPTSSSEGSSANKADDSASGSLRNGTGAPASGTFRNETAAPAAGTFRNETVAPAAGPSESEAERQDQTGPASGEKVLTPKRKQLTAARLSQLENTEEFTYLIFVAGQYLGRNLTRTDVDTLGYFYDELHMSADLIEYLIEYCVGNGHKTIRYIETVGLAWHSDGIMTVQEAKDSAGRYNKDYYAIFKALGIQSHSPISAEIQIMDKWMHTYHFTMDMIREACTRTIMNTAKPTLAYADKILTRWYNDNIKSLEDVKREDENHQKKQSKDRKVQKNGKGTSPSGSFYNFEQRQYDRSLENLLLGVPNNKNTDG
ncbi:MAG TPA: DNA replication protein DnaD [Lachnospiraceae bacterium]|nr:DNA replication protein DnaD [Lachnospiraceae bacterium]